MMVSSRLVDLARFSPSPEQRTARKASLVELVTKSAEARTALAVCGSGKSIHMIQGIHLRDGQRCVVVCSVVPHHTITSL